MQIFISVVVVVFERDIEGIRYDQKKRTYKEKGRKERKFGLL